MRVAFHTLGCKLNQCESEALASAAAERGLSVIPAAQEADIYIINTCTVTSKAEQKARRIIRKILRENLQSAVIVTGCYAQLERAEIEKISDRLIIIPQEEKDILLSLLDEVTYSEDIRNTLRDIRLRKEGIHDPFAFGTDSLSYHTRAFLKIQDGCENRCAYCRVPLARGPSVSLSADRVVERLRILSEHGYREVVLTGVNISSYRDGDTDFSSLLSGILEEDFPFRIRLSSIEPDMIGDALIHLLHDRRICPHFHLPVQSGSDRILKAMGRHYDSRLVREKVAALRAAGDDPFISADIITGFPGESEEDFSATEELLRELDFSQLHVFPFSPRPGTRAFAMTDPVPERISGERSSRLLQLSKTLYGRYLTRWIERDVTMLLLERQVGSSNTWYGVSENYLRLPVSGLPANGGTPGSVHIARIRRYRDICRAEVSTF